MATKLSLRSDPAAFAAESAAIKRLQAVRRGQPAGIEVALRDIVASSPFQPASRNQFDPQRNAADRGLLDSLAELGQVESVGLCEVAAQPGRYQIVYGHRRVAALRHLGRPSVRACVIAGSELYLATATAIENTGAPLTPIEQAELAQLLAERFQLTRKQIAARLGCSERYVKRLRELLRTHAAVRFELAAGSFGAKTAIALGRAPLEHQPRLAAIAAAQHLTEARALELVRHMTATGSDPDAAATTLKLVQPAIAEAPGADSDHADSNTLTPKAATQLLEQALPWLPARQRNRLVTAGAEMGLAAEGLLVAGMLGGSTRVLQRAQAIEKHASVRAALQMLQGLARLRAAEPLPETVAFVASLRAGLEQFAGEHETGALGRA